MCFEVFKSSEACLLSNFSDFFFPKFVCSMVKFSILVIILHRILHLTSQTMYFSVSYSLKIL